MRGLNASVSPLQDFGVTGLHRTSQHMDTKRSASRGKFVGGVFQSRSAGANDVFYYPEGAKEGDVAYIAAMYNLSFAPAGWNMLPNLALSLQLGQWLRHGFKVLSASDLVYPVTIVSDSGGAGLGMLTGVWRGANSIHYRGHVENGEAGESSTTHPGVVPSPNSLGAFSIAIDRDAGSAWSSTWPFLLRGIGGAADSGIYNDGLATWEARRPYTGEPARWERFRTNNSQAVAILELN